ncbi:hypothetical protein FB45DRAFT_862509 [Roridomyces roridus]|uniref:Uncharacterized protein n=1 Tax=Roridomyces roridus TaxID=1738132 RepID=A0AAD7C7L1_9AGAR|nr:hypothetical protein FB45DRAFT_862509 [Roridomyces roridus]
MDLASTLASIVAARSYDTHTPLNALYSHEEACAVLLERRPELRALVDVARETKDYQPVWAHHSVRHNRERNRLYNYLDEIRPHMEQYALGENPIDYWTPESSLDADPSVVAHIRNLRVPSVDDDPRLLIHRLGSFGEKEDLKERVGRIFHKHAYTFLVNTSGSGKTRLSLEGLCRDWGFYFSMTLDGNKLGPDDV